MVTHPKRSCGSHGEVGNPPPIRTCGSLCLTRPPKSRLEKQDEHHNRRQRLPARTRSQRQHRADASDTPRPNSRSTSNGTVSLPVRGLSSCSCTAVVRRSSPTGAASSRLSKAHGACACPSCLEITATISASSWPQREIPGRSDGHFLFWSTSWTSRRSPQRAERGSAPAGRRASGATTAGLARRAGCENESDAALRARRQPP